MELGAQTITFSYSKYYTRRKSSSHTLCLLTATNFPLLLHFTLLVTSNRELTSITLCYELLWTLCCELVLSRTLTHTVLNWTAFSLSYKLWSLTCRKRCIVYCCKWRYWGHVTPPYCCVIQLLQRRLETRGAEWSEGRASMARGGENITHYCCAIAFRGFCISTAPEWGDYATIFIHPYCCSWDLCEKEQLGYKWEIIKTIGQQSMCRIVVWIIEKVNWKCILPITLQYIYQYDSLTYGFGHKYMATWCMCCAVFFIWKSPHLKGKNVIFSHLLFSIVGASWRCRWHSYSGRCTHTSPLHWLDN
jgi:hypothetical protein